MRTFGLVHYGFVNNELWSWYRAGVQYCLDFDTTVFDVGSVGQQEFVYVSKVAILTTYRFCVSGNVINCDRVLPHIVLLMPPCFSAYLLCSPLIHVTNALRSASSMSQCFDQVI
jgi:hypothetical protein